MMFDFVLLFVWCFWTNYEAINLFSGAACSSVGNLQTLLTVRLAMGAVTASKFKSASLKD